MKKTEFLTNVFREFGADAQQALDFVANETNRRKVDWLERTTENSDGLCLPEEDTIADGVYYVGENGHLEPFTGEAPFLAVKYIGVKMGDHRVAVALNDLPGDEDGELQLLPSLDNCPKDSDRYTYDRANDKPRRNAFEDFDGKGNTEHLKQEGCLATIPEGEWIPSLGECGIIMMNLTKVNAALVAAGGTPLKGWHWSSTERSQFIAWVVNFSDGGTYIYGKCNSGAIRPVAAF